MKHVLRICLLALALNPAVLFACEACKKNQPEFLQGITHGTGPEGKWDYVIIVAAIIIVSITLFYAIKFLVNPRENAPDHIKNIVIE
ncbi:MAG TPA: hypothetical protein VLZ83_05950 [Edaphocola sp.]|nr:hypothetical protein [Edaphocola sp.]